MSGFIANLCCRGYIGPWYNETHHLNSKPFITYPSSFRTSAYILQIGTLALFTALVVVNSRLQGRKWRLLRVLGFVATGFSAFAPIVHAALIFPYDQLDKQAGLRYYYIEGVLILIGVIFYIVCVSRFPCRV